MRTRQQVNARYTAASLIEQSTTSICISCGAFVAYDRRYRHDAFHILIEGMDNTLNNQAGQDQLPGMQS